MSWFAARAVRQTRGKEQTKDLLGMRVGMLTVTAQAPSCVRARWRCRCDCGAEVVRESQMLLAAVKSGAKSSCGCHRGRGPK